MEEKKPNKIDKLISQFEKTGTTINNSHGRCFENYTDLAKSNPTRISLSLKLVNLADKKQQFYKAQEKSSEKIRKINPQFGIIDSNYNEAKDKIINKLEKPHLFKNSLQRSMECIARPPLPLKQSGLSASFTSLNIVDNKQQLDFRKDESKYERDEPLASPEQTSHSRWSTAIEESDNIEHLNEHESFQAKFQETAEPESKYEKAVLNSPTRNDSKDFAKSQTPPLAPPRPSKHSRSSKLLDSNVNKQQVRKAEEAVLPKVPEADSSHFGEHGSNYEEAISKIRNKLDNRSTFLFDDVNVKELLRMREILLAKLQEAKQSQIREPKSQYAEVVSNIGNNFETTSTTRIDVQDSTKTNAETPVIPEQACHPRASALIDSASSQTNSSRSDESESKYEEIVSNTEKSFIISKAIKIDPQDFAETETTRSTISAPQNFANAKAEPISTAEPEVHFASSITISESNNKEPQNVSEKSIFLESVLCCGEDKSKYEKAVPNIKNNLGTISSTISDPRDSTKAESEDIALAESELHSSSSIIIGESKNREQRNEEESHLEKVPETNSSHFRDDEAKYDEAISNIENKLATTSSIMSDPQDSAQAKAETISPAESPLQSGYFITIGELNNKESQNEEETQIQKVPEANSSHFCEDEAKYDEAFSNIENKLETTSLTISDPQDSAQAKAETISPAESPLQSGSSTTIGESNNEESQNEEETHLHKAPGTNSSHFGEYEAKYDEAISNSENELETTSSVISGPQDTTTKAHAEPISLAELALHSGSSITIGESNNKKPQSEEEEHFENAPETNSSISNSENKLETISSTISDPQDSAQAKAETISPAESPLQSGSSTTTGESNNKESQNEEESHLEKEEPNSSHFCEDVAKYEEAVLNIKRKLGAISSTMSSLQKFAKTKDESYTSPKSAGHFESSTTTGDAEDNDQLSEREKIQAKHQEPEPSHFNNSIRRGPGGSAENESKPLTPPKPTRLARSSTSLGDVDKNQLYKMRERLQTLAQHTHSSQFSEDTSKYEKASPNIDNNVKITTSQKSYSQDYAKFKGETTVPLKPLKVSRSITSLGDMDKKRLLSLREKLQGKVQENNHSNVGKLKSIFENPAPNIGNSSKIFSSTIGNRQDSTEAETESFALLNCTEDKSKHEEDVLNIKNKSETTSSIISDSQNSAETKEATRLSKFYIKEGNADNVDHSTAKETLRRKVSETHSSHFGEDEAKYEEAISNIENKLVNRSSFLLGDVDVKELLKMREALLAKLQEAKQSHFREPKSQYAEAVSNIGNNYEITSPTRTDFQDSTKTKGETSILSEPAGHPRNSTLIDFANSQQQPKAEEPDPNLKTDTSHSAQEKSDYEETVSNSSTTSDSQNSADTKDELYASTKSAGFSRSSITISDVDKVELKEKEALFQKVPETNPPYCEPNSKYEEGNSKVEIILKMNDPTRGDPQYTTETKAELSHPLELSRLSGSSTLIGAVNDKPQFNVRTCHVESVPENSTSDCGEPKSKYDEASSKIEITVKITNSTRSSSQDSTETKAELPTPQKLLSQSLSRDDVKIEQQLNTKVSEPNPSQSDESNLIYKKADSIIEDNFEATNSKRANFQDSIETKAEPSVSPKLPDLLLSSTRKGVVDDRQQINIVEPNLSDGEVILRSKNEIQRETSVERNVRSSARINFEPSIARKPSTLRRSATFRFSEDAKLQPKARDSLSSKMSERSSSQCGTNSKLMEARLKTRYLYETNNSKTSIQSTTSVDIGDNKQKFNALSTEDTDVELRRKENVQIRRDSNLDTMFTKTQEVLDYENVQYDEIYQPVQIDEQTRSATIIKELITTEESYVKKLEKILKCKNNLKTSLPDILIEKLFCNIEDIYKNQIEFLKILKRRRNEKSVNSAFIFMESIFEHYILYARSRAQSQTEVYDNHMDIIKDIQKKHNDTFDLKYYLLCPTTRLNQYVLLLGQIEKDLIKRKLDSQHIQSSINKIKNVTRRINNLLSIDSIKNLPFTLTEGDNFIMKEFFTLLKPFDKPLEIIAFLFQNVIILTLLGTNGTTDCLYLRHLDLDNVTFLSKKEDPFTFTLEINDMKKHLDKRRNVYEFKTKYPKIKQNWEEILLKVLWEQFDEMKRRTTLGRTPYSVGAVDYIQKNKPLNQLE